MDVTVDDAILYLDQVKMELTDRPSIYTEFLEIMKQFTALRELKKVCCTSDVIFEILDARNPVRAGAI
ncbi:hypothetical protein ScalyP_jg8837, partial [Parmales sp. scaly parma]